jgi:hypothetical protein
MSEEEDPADFLCRVVRFITRNVLDVLIGLENFILQGNNFLQTSLCQVEHAL